jgi:hypothetical protein
MYAGLIPVKSGDSSKQTFFVYQPTIGAPVNEITVWFNGGPGCSSLEGFFQENGRYGLSFCFIEGFVSWSTCQDLDFKGTCSILSTWIYFI